MSDREEASADAESSSYDPELDILSDQFNPLKALLSETKLKLHENAPIYDNVAIFESRMKRGNAPASAQNPKTNTRKTKTNPQSHLPSANVVRRFLPHQEMVKGRGKKLRHTRNLLQTMSAYMENGGPLKWLEQCRVERKRVKVFLRNESTINGYASGYVEVYDKHWNIALSDVKHVWKRKKPHFCTTSMPCEGNESDDTANMDECMRRLQRLGIDVPAINVKSINRKLAECTRSVRQLVIRGEQIAFICADGLPKNQSTNS